MSFIRPEVAKRLYRWREALAGAGAAALGSYWMMVESGALAIIGTALAVAGALLIFAGIQRARFRQGSGGPGIVQITEGQLTYFGPYDAGTLAVDRVTTLSLDPDGAGRAQWVLSHRDGDDLIIPVHAEGAEALFDVFGTLPGLNTEAMLAELQRPHRTRVVLWQKDAPRLH
ncbi:MAG: hypothetical protein KJO78_03475 [Alphaproteobacteria bacterium]|nr:hypothetical protein [Alphaproteobacteria bacterium]